MRLFADECVYRITVDALRSWGHDVITAQEVELSGEDDEKLLAYAIQDGRVLVTSDSDFSNIRYYPPGSHSGIIFVKIRPKTLPQVHQVLQTLLKETRQVELAQTLVIVDRNKYRIRRS